MTRLFQSRHQFLERESWTPDWLAGRVVQLSSCQGLYQCQETATCLFKGLVNRVSYLSTDKSVHFINNKDPWLMLDEQSQPYWLKVHAVPSIFLIVLQLCFGVFQDAASSTVAIFTEATQAHFFAQTSSATNRFSVRQHRISVHFHRNQVGLTDFHFDTQESSSTHRFSVRQMNVKMHSPYILRLYLRMSHRDPGIYLYWTEVIEGFGGSTDFGVSKDTPLGKGATSWPSARKRLCFASITNHWFIALQ